MNEMDGKIARKGLSKLMYDKRRALNLSQSEVAEKCGLTKQSIHTWESRKQEAGKGCLQFAKFIYVLRYCQVLGIEELGVNEILSNFASHNEGQG